jgi:hypothetical protein
MKTIGSRSDNLCAGVIAILAFPDPTSNWAVLTFHFTHT